MTLTDIQLMEQVRAGDDGAFEVLVLRHQRGLINYFYRLSWNRALAEDLAQDVFLRIYEARKRYQAASKFTTWLYRIARNLWVDHVRRRIRRGTPLSLESPVAGDGEGRLVDMLPEHDRGAQEATAVAEKMERVLTAVAALTEAQRELFAMANVQGMKYSEISEILEIPVGTVKTRMHTLMNRLREALNGSPS